MLCLLTISEILGALQWWIPNLNVTEGGHLPRIIESIKIPNRRVENDPYLHNNHSHVVCRKAVENLGDTGRELSGIVRY